MVRRAVALLDLRDRALHRGACGLGVALSVALFLGYAQPVCLALLWAFYLSLVSAGQIFFSFQWDALLLESTLLAVFLVPWTLRRARVPNDPPPSPATWSGGSCSASCSCPAS